jgi:hypothetical protein
MTKRAPLSLSIVAGGWIAGFAVAVVGDYIMLPLIAKNQAGPALAILIGLPWGILVVSVCGLLSTHWADRVQARAAQKPARKEALPKTAFNSLPLLTKILVFLLIAVTIVSVIFSGLPLYGR